MADRVADRARPGPGRVLVLTYAFFTLAAGARSAVQLLTHASEAPVAYALSALAALVYLAGTVTLWRTDARHDRRGRAVTVCVLELCGVLAVGASSLLFPQAFPDATVWSHFGQGYGFVPLVLPVAALTWLRRVHGKERVDVRAGW